MSHNTAWDQTWKSQLLFTNSAYQPTSEPLQFSVSSDPTLAFPTTETCPWWKGMTFDGSTTITSMGTSFTASISGKTLTISTASGTDSGTWTANEGGTHRPCDDDHGDRKR